MNIYTFDYTKAAEAEKCLYNAQLFLSQDRLGLAENTIAKARQLLNEFLSSDNMVVDPDVYGWIRLIDHLEILNMINNKDGEPGLKS